MRCPQEAGQTAEERHSCEHRADEGADELSHRNLAGQRDEPMCNEPLHTPVGDSVQRLDDRGDGQAGSGSDGHPACDDPRASGHAHLTQAGPVRCRVSCAAGSSVGFRLSITPLPARHDQSRPDHLGDAAERPLVAGRAQRFRPAVVPRRMRPLFPRRGRSLVPAAPSDTDHVIMIGWPDPGARAAWRHATDHQIGRWSIYGLFMSKVKCS